MTGPHLAMGAGAAISRRRTGPSGKTGPSGEPGAPPGAGQPWGTRAARLLGRHWLLVVLLAAGLALRIAAQTAYQPALIYVDTLKYLYGASPGADPLGYTLVLRAIVQARRNVLISGGTGSGKTTLLNAMSAYIDITERVITIMLAEEY